MNSYHRWNADCKPAFEDRTVPHSVKPFWWRPAKGRLCILFWSKNIAFDNAQRDISVLHRYIVLK